MFVAEALGSVNIGLLHSYLTAFVIIFEKYFFFIFF